MKDPYKNTAKWYDHIFGSMNIGLRKIGLKMYPVNEGMAVLDIGCGTGAHLELYQQQNCHVYGIDISPAMIKVARMKLGEQANLRLGSANRMEFDDDSFDLILCFTVLHEMPQPLRKEVLEEARRVLKHDGRILLIDFHPGSTATFKGLYTKIIITIVEIIAGREHYRNYRHFMRNGGLPVLINSMGFEMMDQKKVGGGNFGIFLLKK